MATVKELMTTDCVSIAPTTSVQETANLMRDHDIGFVPIVEGKQLVGVVTDRDIVIRCVAENKPCSTPVKDVLSGQIATIAPDASIEEAAKLMAKEQIRRLPVVEQGRLVGILAIGDIAVDRMHDEKAGKALSEISESEQTLAGIH